MRFRLALCAASFALFLLAVTSARPALVPGPPMRDFEAYWAAGATYLAGEDPYSRAIWNAEQRVDGVDLSHDETLPFVGPPATLLPFALLARLPFRSAAYAWTAIVIASLAALVWASARGASTRGTPAIAFASTAAMALSFGPVTSDIALGQIAMIAFAGALVLVAEPLRTFEASCAAFVGFLQPNVSIALVTQLGRNRRSLAIALGAAGAYAAGAFAAGFDWPLRYLRHLAEHASAERFGDIQYTPAAIAFALGAAPNLALAFGAACALAAVVCGIALALRIRDRFAAFAACSTLLPFVATFFHEHDLLAAFPAAAWCAVRANGWARAAALAGALCVSIDWLGLSQRPGGIAQSALLAGAALCAFLATSGRTEPARDLTAAAAVACLFVAGAWLGVTHRLPIWPNDLGAYHAPAGATIAAVWQQEQQRSGLLAAVPAWGIQRALSLLGCSLLALAMFASTPGGSTRAFGTRSP